MHRIDSDSDIGLTGDRIRGKDSVTTVSTAHAHSAKRLAWPIQIHRVRPVEIEDELLRSTALFSTAQCLRLEYLRVAYVAFQLEALTRWVARVEDQLLLQPLPVLNRVLIGVDEFRVWY